MVGRKTAMTKLQDYEIRHIRKMREFAPECMVLLKADGTFPLKEPCKIALYGSGARNTLKGGTGSGEVNSRTFSTVETGLENAGFTVTTKKWLSDYDVVYKKARTQFVKQIKKTARQKHISLIALAMGAVMPEPDYELPLDGAGDTAVYVLSRISGEGNDRKPIPGDALLTKTEIRDILQCRKQYKHFLLVLNVGGVVDLSPVLEVENILLLSQLGVAMGDAFADVLLGKAYPSGKLTTTWAAFDDYCKEGTFGDHKDTYYSEGLFVGYRYFQRENKAPVFPFGYGLGYTDFDVSPISFSSDEGHIRVNVRVKNIGSYMGKETVQLYVSKQNTGLIHPPMELVAFAKTGELAPSHAEQLSIACSLEDIKSFDEVQDQFVIKAGTYLFYAGNSSDRLQECGRMVIAEDIAIEEDYSMVQPSKCAQEFASTLSDEQLSLLCVGLHQEGKQAEVIGSAAQRVAGAAGENYSGIDGVPAIVMADGPAGLRLSQKYLKTQGGAEAITEALPAGMSDFLPGILNTLTKFKAKRQLKGNVQYQYCTALPVGTAMAQSWNLKLAEECGDIVGAEMEHFGVNLWLAPALNIHRSILCGRNYEYYSEDPVVSGEFAAAVTAGVQRHNGRGVTLKHFCCNNQETNRYMSNSIVDKRTLYELYLRAFEIPVKKAHPAAIMTSYNLLNGIHTSESEALLKGVLRTKWGYSGLIISDWVVPMVMLKGQYYPPEKAAESIKAGNDLFMPGCTADQQEILSALQGTNPRVSLRRKEVEYCAAFVLDAAWKLCGDRK